MGISRSISTVIGGIFLMVLLAAVYFFPDLASARNIHQYKDTISNSAPDALSNHTFSFQIKTSVAPGGFVELVPPGGFEMISTTTFSSNRNVQMFVNGTERLTGPALSSSEDFVEIFPGSPGMIRYTLNSSAGLIADDFVEIRIGNHTTLANEPLVEFSTSTGTTTVPGDIKPIKNSIVPGTHEFEMTIYDGGEVARAGFLIALIETVGVGPVDTTEEIPPVRFNGAPTGELGGTTLGVELSLETDEFAVCRYSSVAGQNYQSMINTFTTTGSIFHSVVIAVTPDSINNFFVRCIDDENNFNIDDYVITFSVNPPPSGQSNVDGGTEGDGTGTGNDGTGSGGGSGGTSGSSDGEAPTTGGTSGGGGSGGGGGGGGGGGSGSSAGGGFESADGQYRSGDAQVLITGYAPARSKVVALVDGKIAEEVTAGAQGIYELTISEIARGAYTFGIYAIDTAGVKTSTLSNSFTVAGARESSLSNMNIPPSLKLTPDPVNPGQVLTASGFSLPNALITIENEKEGSAASRKQFTVTAGSNGAWSIIIPTDSLSNGTYKARVKASSISPLVTTNYSNYVLYGVGQSATRPLSTDLNTDGKVNLVDFSILLFWWNSDGGDSNPPADINSDNRVNLTDFSILLFNWTG